MFFFTSVCIFLFFSVFFFVCIGLAFMDDDETREPFPFFDMNVTLS